MRFPPSPLPGAPTEHSGPDLHPSALPCTVPLHHAVCLSFSTRCSAMCGKYSSLGRCWRCRRVKCLALNQSAEKSLSRNDGENSSW